MDYHTARKALTLPKGRLALAFFTNPALLDVAFNILEQRGHCPHPKLPKRKLHLEWMRALCIPDWMAEKAPKFMSGVDPFDEEASDAALNRIFDIIECVCVDDKVVKIIKKLRATKEELAHVGDGPGRPSEY